MKSRSPANWDFCPLHYESERGSVARISFGSIIADRSLVVRQSFPSVPRGGSPVLRPLRTRSVGLEGALFVAAFVFAASALAGLTYGAGRLSAPRTSSSS